MNSIFLSIILENQKKYHFSQYFGSKKKVKFFYGHDFELK